jgi:serine/threonine protein kinase
MEARLSAPEIVAGYLVGEGRYEVQELIDMGGMGSVYHALDLRLGNRPVALKVLHAELLADPNANARMKAEALALSRIRHVNVVGIIDCFEVVGRLALVLEFIPGGALRARVTEGPIGWEQARDLMAQILDGLQAIHDIGLVHRDIKTANVLMDGETPKVADLGIAHDTWAAGTTGHGQSPGTPEYMSPEQIRGQRLDARSDIYACGVVLFELLTGDLPFGGDNAFAIKEQHVSLAPDLAKLPGDTPGHIKEAVGRALAKAPEARFHSARDMAECLRQTPSVSSAPRPVEPPVEASPLEPLFNASSPVEPPLPPAVDLTDTPPGPAHSSTPFFLAAGVLLVVVVMALMMSDSFSTDGDVRVNTSDASGGQDAKATTSCAEARMWEGHFKLSTVVHGDKANMKKVNGHYDIEGRIDDGDGTCRVNLDIVKTGYAPGGVRKPTEEGKRQRGTLSFIPRQAGGKSHGAGSVVLTRPDAKRPQDTYFELQIGEPNAFSGWWHYERASWTSADAWGSLIAKRDALGYAKHTIGAAQGEPSKEMRQRLSELREQRDKRKAEEKKAKEKKKAKRKDAAPRAKSSEEELEETLKKGVKTGTRVLEKATRDVETLLKGL